MPPKKSSLILKLSLEMERRFNELSEQTGRPVSSLVRQALTEFLDDQEDYRVAVRRLGRKVPTVPLKKVIERLRLDL